MTSPGSAHTVARSTSVQPRPGAFRYRSSSTMPGAPMPRPRTRPPNRFLRSPTARARSASTAVAGAPVCRRAVLASGSLPSSTASTRQASWVMIAASTTGPSGWAISGRVGRPRPPPGVVAPSVTNRSATSRPTTSVAAPEPMPSSRLASARVSPGVAWTAASIATARSGSALTTPPAKNSGSEFNRSVTAATRTSTPAPAHGDVRVAVAMAVLTLATFAAVTAETLPVGLLPMIAHDLSTSESQVGLLVSAYAVVVAVASLPLTALLARWPRRRALTVLLLTYAAGNAVFAATSDYGVAVTARLLAGLAHAGFFSVAVGAAVSLVPPARAGRVTAIVFTGVTIAFTAGVPAGTALGTAVGWRWAFAGIAATLLILAGLTAVLLPTPLPPAATAPAPLRRVLRRRPVLLVAALTVMVTLGHYTAFTYVSPILRAAGIGEGHVSLVLFGYGAAGALGLALAGAFADRRPRPALAGAVLLIALPLGTIGALGTSAVLTVVATVVWGVAFGALPTLTQTAARRAAPDAGDAAPGLTNATTNVGIAGGGVLGARELLVTAPPALALTGAALAALALLLVLLARRAADPAPERRGVAPAAASSHSVA